MELWKWLKYRQREEFAAKLGITREYLSRIKHGHGVSFELALRISVATRGAVSVEELLSPDAPWPVLARLRRTDPLPAPASAAEVAPPLSEGSPSAEAA